MVSLSFPDTRLASQSSQFVAWKKEDIRLVDGVLFVEETEEMDDGEDWRALGMAQNECRLD
jgi:hypothetical protein